MVWFLKPADKLFVDFAGKKIHYTFRDPGDAIACYLFVACLPHSEPGFLIAVVRIRLLIFCMHWLCCLAFPGVPYLFADSHNGAKEAACIHSFFAICWKHEVNPHESIKYIFEHLIATRVTGLEKLYPQNYQNVPTK